MKFAMRRNVLGSLLCGAVLASLSLAAPLAHASKDHPEIGFCIDDLRVERWSRDRDYFVAAAEKLGAKVSVQSADERGASDLADRKPDLARRGCHRDRAVQFEDARECGRRSEESGHQGRFI